MYCRVNHSSVRSLHSGWRCYCETGDVDTGRQIGVVVDDCWTSRLGKFSSFLCLFRRCAMMVSPNSSRETTRPSKCLHPFSPPQGLHKRHRFNGTTPVSFGLSRLSIAARLSMAGPRSHGPLRIRQQQALQERFVSRPPRGAR